MEQTTAQGIAPARFFIAALCCAALFSGGCKQPVQPERNKDMIDITYSVEPRAGQGFTQKVKKYQTAAVWNAAGLKYEGYQFGGWKPDKTKDDLYMPGTEPGKKPNGDPWPENLGGSITVADLPITLYDVWTKVVDPRKLAGIWKIIAKNGSAALGYCAFNGFKYEFWPDRSSAPDPEAGLALDYEADGERVRSGGADLFRYAQDRDENGVDVLIITMKDGVEYRCKRDASQIYTFLPGATEADGATITGYTPRTAASSLVIPARILGLDVTAIYTRAFFQHTALDSVVIPGGVTVIGDEAFSGCGLSSASIPDTVVHIGARAFQGHKFTAIAIPGGLRDTVVYPDGTGADGNPAVCPPGIVGVSIAPAGAGQPSPDTPHTRFFPGIGAAAFADSGLPPGSANTATVTFADGTSAYSIGEGAFARAKIGGTLRIPPGLRDFAVAARDPSPGRTFPGIGAHAFDAFKAGYGAQNSISALDFAWGSALASIGNGAFRYNSISVPPGFPPSLVRIGEIIPGAATAPAGTFEGNPLAGTLTIPGTVREIGPYAFANPYAYVNNALAGGITTLSLGDGLERIGDGAFAIDTSRAGALNSIDTGKGRLVGLVLPASLISIGRDAFMDNKIAVLDLSGAVALESIGAGAFSRNTIGKLEKVPPKLAVLGDGAFRQNLFGGTDNSGMGIDLSTASGITEIGASVFGSAKDLKAVVIPEGITVIRRGAFSGSAALTELDLPATLESIEGEKTGEGAFFNTALTKITIRRPLATPLAFSRSDMLFGKNDKNGAFRTFYTASPRPGVYEWRTWQPGDPAESDAEKARLHWRHKPLP